MTLEKKIYCERCGESYPPGWPHSCDENAVKAKEHDKSKRNDVLDEAIEAVKSMLPCKNHTATLAIKAIEKIKQQ